MAMSALPVPYISQLINGNGGANCGPACLSMGLGYRGVIAPTQGAMLYVADIVRDGVPDNIGRTGGYTTLQQLIDCAAWFDQQMVWIGSWASVHASLEAGEPVILLVDNTALWPRQYPRSPAFDAHHFVLLTGYTPPTPGAPHDAATDTFMVNDPLSIYAWGPAPYTAASLMEASNLVGGVQGLAFVPMAQEGEDMGIITELNQQVTNLRAEIVGLNGIGEERERQIAALRQEIAGKDSTIGALQHDVLEPLEARIAEMEEALRHAVAVAAKRPSRVEVVLPDETRVAYVPEAA